MSGSQTPPAETPKFPKDHQEVHEGFAFVVVSVHKYPPERSRISVLLSLYGVKLHESNSPGAYSKRCEQA